MRRNFSLWDSEMAATLLLRSLSVSKKPWKETAQKPEDLEALERLLGKTLYRASQIVSEKGGYHCYDIAKWRGKKRRIESPNGFCAREPLSWMFAKDIASDLAIIHHTKRRSYQAISLANSHHEYSVYDEALEGVDNFAKLRHVFTSDWDDIPVLQQAQKAIHIALSQSVPLTPSVCGFRPNYWAYQGLREMLNPFYFRWEKRIESVYQLDIRNFFPSVTEEMVQKALWESLKLIIPEKNPLHRYIEMISSLLAYIASYEWRLPQWWHTSPLFANIVAQRLIDLEILWLRRSFQADKKNHQCTLWYGRYADDLVFISSRSLPQEFRDTIDLIVRKHFTLAEEKRVYEEWKGFYNIWWAVVLANRKYPSWTERRIQLWCKEYGDFRFKIPKKYERRLAAHALKVSEELWQWNEEEWGGYECECIHQTLGYFSHAYNVLRYWGVVTSTKDGRKYFLSQELLHAWEKFRFSVSQFYGREMFLNTFQKIEK